MEQTLDWIGYTASLIILISLLMRSVKRLRFVNLIGAFLFAVYGYMIASYPVMIMNVGIMFINVTYLVNMLKRKDYFTLVPSSQSDGYTQQFLAYYENDITKAIAIDHEKLTRSTFAFFIVRNLIPAGLFVVYEENKETLEIVLDYATPAYRDFQTGRFAYKKTQAIFKAHGYKEFITETTNKTHQAYLIKMGFEPHNKKENTFIKSI